MIKSRLLIFKRLALILFLVSSPCIPQVHSTEDLIGEYGQDYHQEPTDKSFGDFASQLFGPSGSFYASTLSDYFNQLPLDRRHYPEAKRLVQDNKCCAAKTTGSILRSLIELILNRGAQTLTRKRESLCPPCKFGHLSRAIMNSGLRSGTTGTFSTPGRWPYPISFPDIIPIKGCPSCFCKIHSICFHRPFYTCPPDPPCEPCPPTEPPTCPTCPSSKPLTCPTCKPAVCPSSKPPVCPTVKPPTPTKCPTCKPPPKCPACPPVIPYTSPPPVPTSLPKTTTAPPKSTTTTTTKSTSTTANPADPTELPTERSVMDQPQGRRRQRSYDIEDYQIDTSLQEIIGILVDNDTLKDQLVAIIHNLVSAPMDPNTYRLAFIVLSYFEPNLEPAILESSVSITKKIITVTLNRFKQVQLACGRCASSIWEYFEPSGRSDTKATRGRFCYPCRTCPPMNKCPFKVNCVKKTCPPCPSSSPSTDPDMDEY